MAEQPGKDVFDDGESEVEEGFVVDEAEEAELKAGTEEAAEKAGTDDIEIVLAEEEKQGGEADDDAEPEVEAAEAGDAEEQEAEQDPDDDLKSYSKSVQARIQRERKIARRAREEAATTVAGEVAKRIDAERKSLAAHKNLTEVLLVNIDSQIKSKSAELKQLLEAGDTDKQVDVQGELDDLRAKKRDIESAKVSLDRQAEEFDRNAEAQIAAAKAPQVSPAAQQWMGQNKWYGRKEFAAETLMAREVDRKLATERSDKTSPEYFKELSRRLRNEMPDLAEKARRVLAPKSGVRSSVAPVSRSASSVRTDAASKRRVTLDKADIQNMVGIKLDPTNPQHVAAYAREKLALNSQGN